MKNSLKEISTLFDMRGDLISAEPYGSGHINDTFAAVYDQAEHLSGTFTSGLTTRFLRIPRPW